MKIPKINIPKIPKIRIEVVKCSYAEANIVPDQYKNFLVDMNNLFAFNDTDVYRGREKEVNWIFNCLLKTRNSNVILLGEHGVGKTTVVQSTVHHILQKKCPKQLRNMHFIFWHLEKTLAVLSSEDSKLQQKLSGAFEFLNSTDNIVVVLDQVHLMTTTHLLRYYFSILLKNPNIRVIGVDTEEDFYDFFEWQTKIFSLIDIVHIPEPKSKQVYPMISEYVDVLAKRHEIAISKEMVEYTVSVSAAFSSEMCNPGLTLNFIEKSMIVAKRRKHTEVTKKDINSNFNFDYKLFKEMSPEDKKITAYHEAGHFIVSKMSEHIRNYKTTAITIVPAEHFLGVTMFEFEPEKQTSCDSDYFIDHIATDLAGRVAETILQGEGAKLTSGAFSDLKNATQTARDIVTEYGMVESVGQNMTYFCNYDISDLALLSEDTKKDIDKETKRLISEAYERANKILNENLELLDLIANELLVNEVLDEKDLDRLCNQVKKTE